MTSHPGATKWRSPRANSFTLRGPLLSSKCSPRPGDRACIRSCGGVYGVTKNRLNATGCGELSCADQAFPGAGLLVTG